MRIVLIMLSLLLLMSLLYSEGTTLNSSFTDIDCQDSLSFSNQEDGTRDVFWDVTILSNLPNIEIRVDGINSGFFTPHTFYVLEGTSAIYSLVVPPPLGCMPIEWNSGPVFTSMTVEFFLEYLPMLYNVTITSSPPDQPIHLDGVFSGYFTPYTFELSEWGTYTFTIGNPMYNWSPSQFVLSNISSDMVCDFIGGTVPVELSSFNAILTSESNVILSWVTETETQVLGFNILRSESDNVIDTDMMNQFIITATNTSQQHTYSYLDTINLQNGHSYKYWLESVDLNGSSEFFGPVSITINNTEQEPEIPDYTGLFNSYPNPFTLNTKIPFSLKYASDVNIDIFDIKGKVVFSFYAVNKAAGNYEMTWNGINNKGLKLPAGTYICRMTAGEYSTIRKLVLLK